MRHFSANTRAPKTPKAPLGVLPVGAPLDRLCLDLLGPFPISTQGNRHLLVVVDWFSKWVEIFPIPDATAETCAEKFVNEFMARFGLPLTPIKEETLKVISLSMSASCFT